MKRPLHRLCRHVAVLATALSVALTPVSAQSRSEKASLPVVRDAEIEALVADYARPILKAAGLSRSGIQIVLVNSPGFNAFVAGRRIFINTGAITATETPNQLIGIIAHEIGHLAGGHQQRLREQLERSQTIAIVAGLLGAGIAVAGASTGAGGAAQAGAGLMSGGSAAAQRSLLSYQRGEESAADRTALTYLDRTGQSGKGLLETFSTLDRNNLFAAARSNYLSSHPMPRDRIAALEAAARESQHFGRADPPALVERHNLARAKIAAYNGGMGDVRRLFARDPRGLPALYGDAIATQLAGSTASALQKIDALIAARPNNPWFHEMRGETLMAAGRASEAAAAYSRAVKLDGTGSGLLKAQVGQAIVSGGDRSQMPKAIELIRGGLQSDPANASAYRFLAMAYGQLGEVGQAELATAEGYWHGGNIRQAQIFATRAQQKLKRGSPSWLQAQDIIQTKPRS
ncbi:M48 family metalloprotease [Aurantimonas aggregata]|uniref:M48 family metalloprotease n=1 Tax=Aurantimonas aggregata TaxID=2047720 RepID=A0A6L9MMA9_9HYPH|nr:M48 family metalloprotease [Aurantimonas aggregata]NDV88638.1 M48 family metalloprotease [Aurantimonas aggregata]